MERGDRQRERKKYRKSMIEGEREKNRMPPKEREREKRKKTRSYLKGENERETCKSER